MFECRDIRFWLDDFNVIRPRAFQALGEMKVLQPLPPLFGGKTSVAMRMFTGKYRRKRPWKKRQRGTGRFSSAGTAAGLGHVAFAEPDQTAGQTCEDDDHVKEQRHGGARFALGTPTSPKKKTTAASLAPSPLNEMGIKRIKATMGLNIK